MPSIHQLVLVSLAILLFGVGLGLSVARLRIDSEGLRIAAKACVWSGLCAALAVLIWHTAARSTGNWLPLEDNFEAFVWLAVLLAGFVLYVQRTRPLGGLDWFVLPIVIVMLVAAIVLGKAKPKEYVGTTWYWIHLVTVFAGALAFAIAGAAGAMYLLANRRLRSKALPHGPRLGSLERLERITFASVTLGFALLTVGLITGWVVLKSQGKAGMGSHWYTSPKVVMAVSAWVVYAIVLHAPINPSFRGRKVAVLSIFGFLLMVGTLVAVNFVPAGVGGSR